MPDQRPTNPLSGVPLDRVAARRSDTAWIAATFAAPDTRVFPVSAGRVLVSALPATDPVGRGADPQVAPSRAVSLTVAEFGPLPMTDDPRADDPTADTPSAEGGHTGPAVLLGVRDETPYTAVEVSAARADAVLRQAGEGAAWSELRPAALALPATDAALVAYARAMVWWHSRHRFCGVCGTPTVVEEAGHVRACPTCGARHFPRTDPAVIVLITHWAAGAATRDEVCLLGNQPGWPAAMYSTLAGFVEPGESLEDTVRREMHEEAGVRVDDIRYQSSQPWPFPQSLMLGFTARARDRTVRVDGTELRDARWFTRAELDAALADRSVWIPPPLSISRQLIEGWRAAGTG